MASQYMNSSVCTNKEFLLQRYLFGFTLRLKFPSPSCTTFKVLNSDGT